MGVSREMTDEEILLLQSLNTQVHDLSNAVFGFGSGNGLLRDVRSIREDMERRQREEEALAKEAAREKRRDDRARMMIFLGSLSALIAAVGVIWGGLN